MVTSGSIDDTLMSPMASLSRTAFSGDVVLRCTSLCQSICSDDAPGIIVEVNICRNAGLSCPQPWRMSSTMALPSALRPAARVSAVEHKLRNALGMAHRIRDADRAALGDSEQGEPIQARRVDDCFQIAHEGLEGDVVHVPVRESVATFVVTHQLVVT